MGNKRIVQLSYLSLFVSILFYIFFTATKHISFLSNVTSFLEDPYDAIGSFAVLASILIAVSNLLRLAVLKVPPHNPMLVGEEVLYSAMAILLLLDIFILIANYSAKRNLVASQNTRTEIDILFRSKLLSPINPLVYPIRFSILFSISLSLLIAIIEIVAEGPAPTLQQMALVFTILTAIGSVGFFIILMLIGRYLGILGKLE